MISHDPSSQRYDLHLHTFGCKVNTYDSGLLQARLEPVRAKAGAGPRVHILNTCAVTAEASREAAKLARRIKSKDPLATVVVTGCGAQVDGEIFDRLPAADLVIANSHKGQLERILDQYFKFKGLKGGAIERVYRSNIFRKDDLEAGGGIEAGHTRAFLKIQDGCNSFCTYCVIPFARGKSRSIPVGELVRRINELAASGVGEVVLTGVHIGDYEDEEAGRKFFLHDLVAAILEKTTVPRIRLTSLEPVELTPEILALYRQSDRLCRHFHMSIQSANTPILAAMRRKYDASAVEKSLLAIEREVPGAFVGMDVITGFPGEGEEEFLDTYERLARLPWTRIHVFPYSERPGTKAASFEGVVARDVRVLRSRRLRELSAERFARAAQSQVGKTVAAMVLKSRFLSDGGDSAVVEGLTRDYWSVRITGVSRSHRGGAFDGEDLHDLARLRGREIQVRLTGFLETERMEGILEGQWARDER